MKPMIAAMLLAAVALPAAAANVQVTDVWARATMPGQKVSAAYMTIQSDVDAKLVGVASAAVPRVELHEMKMDGEVMRMREVRTLDLPKGKPVKLEPGGYHIMLMNLGKPIAAGDAVPLTLTIETGGKQETVEVKADARGPGGEPAQHMHHHHWAAGVQAPRIAPCVRRSSSSAAPAFRIRPGSGWPLSAASVSSAAHPVRVPFSSRFSRRAVKALTSLKRTRSSASRKTSRWVSDGRIRRRGAMRCTGQS